MLDQEGQRRVRPKAVGKITFWIVFTSIHAITFMPCLVAFLFLFPLKDAISSCFTTFDCIDPFSVSFFLFALFFMLLTISFGIFLLKVAVDFYALKAWTYPWAVFVTWNGIARFDAYKELFTPEMRQAFGRLTRESDTDNPKKSTA